MSAVKLLTTIAGRARHVDDDDDDCDDYCVLSVIVLAIPQVYAHHRPANNSGTSPSGTANNRLDSNPANNSGTSPSSVSPHSRSLNQELDLPIRVQKRLDSDPAIFEQEL